MINKEIIVEPPKKNKYRIYIVFSMLLLLTGAALMFFGFDDRSFLFFVVPAAYFLVVGFSNLNKKVSKIFIKDNILVVVKNGVVIFRRDIADIQKIEFYSGDEVFTLYDSRSIVISLKPKDSFSFYVNPFTNDQIKLMCSWINV